MRSANLLGLIAIYLAVFISVPYWAILGNPWPLVVTYVVGSTYLRFPKGYKAIQDRYRAILSHAIMPKVPRKRNHPSSSS